MRQSRIETVQREALPAEWDGAFVQTMKE